MLSTPLRKRFCLIALALGVQAQALPAQANWNMFRGNAQRTAHAPGDLVAPYAKPLWIDTLGGPILSSPAIEDDVLYVGARDSCAYAINAANGEILWKTRLADNPDASPLVYGKAVVMGCRNAGTYSIAKSNGEILRHEKDVYVLSSPAVDHSGRLSFSVGNPLDQLTILEKLGTSYSFTDVLANIDLGVLTYSSPAMLGNMVYVGTANGIFHAVEIPPTYRFALNTPKWTIETGGEFFLSTPAADSASGMVFFAPGNYDRNIYAADLQTGEIKWKRDALSQRVAPSPKDAKDAERSRTPIIGPHKFIQLLRLSPGHRHAAVRFYASQGIAVPVFGKSVPGLSKKLATAANSDFYAYGGMKTSSPAVNGNAVYVVQKELGYPAPRFTLFALDKTNGDAIWPPFSEIRMAEPMAFCSSPVVTDSMVIAGWGEGIIRAFNAQTGDILWTDSLSGEIVSSPAIANGRLYVATWGGKVYAYSLSKSLEGMSFAEMTYCYPNPTPGPSGDPVSKIQVYVSENAEMFMTVYNMDDKPVFRVKRSMSARETFTHLWNISNVANGIYFARVKVTYANGKEDRKIVKIAVLR